MSVAIREVASQNTTPERLRFASRLAEAAQDRGYNVDERGWQAELGRDSGVGQSGINRLMRLERSPAPKTVERLAAHLGVRAAWLQWGEEPKAAELKSKVVAK